MKINNIYSNKILLYSINQSYLNYTENVCIVKYNTINFI